MRAVANRLAGALSLAFLLTAPATAQRTFIVDINGGAGSHFRNIQPALQAAAHGDTILVRRGDYPESLTTSKALAVVAEAGTRLVIPQQRIAVTIAGVPAGRTLVWKGMSFADVSMRVEACPGQVVLDGLVLDAVACQCQGSSLGIDGCAQVIARNVSIHGARPLSCTSSRIAMIDCDIVGTDYHNGAAAAFRYGCEVTIAGTTVQGGGLTGWAAMDLYTSRLVLTRGSSVRTILGAAIGAVGGAIDLDPSVVLVSPSGPPIVGSATVTTRAVPACATDGFPAGQVATVLVTGPAASPFCVFVGEPMPVMATPYGLAWLDLARAQVLVCQTIGAAGTFTVSFTTPVGLPPGFAFALQAGVLLPAGVELSQPGLGVTR